MLEFFFTDYAFKKNIQMFLLTGYTQGSGILHYAHGDSQKTHLIQQGMFHLH